jgi:hypothetical protein
MLRMLHLLRKGIDNDRYIIEWAVYSLQCSNRPMAHCNSLEIRDKQGGWDGSL